MSIMKYQSFPVKVQIKQYQVSREFAKWQTMQHLWQLFQIPILSRLILVLENIYHLLTACHDVFEIRLFLQYSASLNKDNNKKHFYIMQFYQTFYLTPWTFISLLSLSFCYFSRFEAKSHTVLKTRQHSMHKKW